ncbi:MAG: hypothetical protein V4864_20645 [Pseudomonadota bacterium]
MRAVPIGRGLASCDSVLARLPAFPENDLAGAWEIGRLVFAPEYRSGYDSLKKCMQMAFLYLVENADFNNGWALCGPVLVRLYRRFGFAVAEANAVTTEEEKFSLIHGAVPDVLVALAGESLRTPQEPAHELVA